MMEHTNHNHTHGHAPMEFGSTEEALRFLTYTVSHNEAHHADLEATAEYLEQHGFMEGHTLLHKAAACMEECNRLIQEALETMQDKSQEEQ